MGNQPGVILCTHSGAYASLVLKLLLEADALNVIGVVNSTRVLSKQESQLRSGLQLVQQCGLVYALNLSLVTTGYSLFSRIIGGDNFYSLTRKHGIELYNTSDINDAASVEFLRQQQPDYIVSAFFNQLIGAEARGVVTKGCMNIHPSLLPDYKGVDPAFYMLLNRETAFGVSLHYLDEGFDTGDIIEQRRVAISPDDNLYQIYRKLFVEGTKMAIAAISSQQGQNDQRQPQAAGGRYDSWPTASQVKAFSQQGNRLVSSGSFWNSLVKPELV